MMKDDSIQLLDEQIAPCPTVSQPFRPYGICHYRLHLCQKLQNRNTDRNPKIEKL